MLKIRLTRVGKKHDPLYRIIVTEHTNPVKGKFIQIIGNYNPKTKDLVLDEEKALEWMNKGAKPSNTVAKFFELNKIKHKSVVVNQFNKKPKKIKEETSNPESKPTVEKIEETEIPSTEEILETSEDTKNETEGEIVKSEEQKNSEKVEN